MTLGERNSSPPPWLAYVSPSHWGAYGPRTSPLARHLLRRPQHCTPLEFWAHGPVDASVHFLKWTGAFPEVAREPHPGPAWTSPVRLAGNLPRSTSPGSLRVAREPYPGLAYPPWHALPGTRVRPSPGTPCRGASHSAFTPENGRKGFPPLFLGNGALAHASRCLGTPGTRTSTLSAHTLINSI